MEKSHFPESVRLNPRVTQEQVQARTRELAVLAGRDSTEISQVDYEQAKRELTGESDGERQQAVLQRALDVRSGASAPDAAGHLALADSRADSASDRPESCSP